MLPAAPVAWGRPLEAPVGADGVLDAAPVPAGVVALPPGTETMGAEGLIGEGSGTGVTVNV